MQLADDLNFHAEQRWRGAAQGLANHSLLLLWDGWTVVQEAQYAALQ